MNRETKRKVSAIYNEQRSKTVNEQELKILRSAMNVLDTIGDETYDKLLDAGCLPKDTSHGLFLILQELLTK